MRSILLVNLGTPAAPTAEAVRAYLAEFLSDPRVVELPRLLWLPILHGIVLRTRPARSAEKYRLIWTREGSPLAVNTARQAARLAERTGLRVAFAMRYGEPRIRATLGRLDSPVVVPLYPQYSESTTGSVLGALPAGTPVVRDFHAHPAYIHALAESVRSHWSAAGRPDRLVMSFHGLPQRAVDRGDPYQRQCFETARLLAGALGLGADAWLVTFQSRFGAAKWLQPYTEPTLVELARAGMRTVDVVCPGFPCDCLETLEEINIGARQAFLNAGGKDFRYIPCLNDMPAFIDALADIARGASAP